MRNLKQLLGICEHKWKNVGRDEVKVVGSVSGLTKDQWYLLIMQCEKCGKIKSVKV